MCDVVWTARPLSHLPGLTFIEGGWLGLDSLQHCSHALGGLYCCCIGKACSGLCKHHDASCCQVEMHIALFSVGSAAFDGNWTRPDS